MDPSVSVMVDIHNTIVNNCFSNWASPSLQQRYLPRLASDSLGAFALSESSSGSDAFALQTRALRDGGDYVLEGEKLWISNAEQAALFLVMANAAVSLIHPLPLAHPPPPLMSTCPPICHTPFVTPHLSHTHLSHPICHTSHLSHSHLSHSHFYHTPFAPCITRLCFPLQPDKGHRGITCFVVPADSAGSPSQPPPYPPTPTLYPPSTPPLPPPLPPPYPPSTPLYPPTTPPLTPPNPP